MAEVRQGGSTICLGFTEGEAAKVASSGLPPGGKSTIYLGMDSVTDIPKREMLAPPGGKSTICLGMDPAASAPVSSNAFACGAHQNSGNVLTERPTTLLHAPPGGRATICLGMDTEQMETPKRIETSDGNSDTSDLQSFRPAGKSTAPSVADLETERPLTFRPVGGEDHIVLGAEKFQRADTTHRATAGGNSSICFGTDISEWKVSSKALGQTLTPSPAELPADMPSETPEEPQTETSTAAAVSPSTDMSMKEEQTDEAKEDEAEAHPETEEVCVASPARSRLPPGGVSSVVLGTAASEWKDRSKDEVKQLKQDVPTPARSIRAPPGGAATVLLG